MTEPVVRAVDLGQRYGSRAVLRSIRFELSARERLAVLGDNGAGKTTLLRLLATATRPGSGRLELFGLDAVAERHSLRRRIGYLAHQPGLYPNLTMVENLEFFATLFQVDRSRVKVCLEQVELAAQGSRPAAELSRGIQQRLALARSLLHDPELWVLDEPDSSLDEPGRGLLDRLARGRTVVMATHDRSLAAEICGRFLRIEGGEAQEGSGIDTRPRLEIV